MMSLAIADSAGPFKSTCEMLPKLHTPPKQFTERQQELREKTMLPDCP